MLERCQRSFWMTLNTPVGVAWPGTPVETRECAIGRPSEYRVSCCLLIETTTVSTPLALAATSSLSLGLVAALSRDANTVLFGLAERTASGCGAGPDCIISGTALAELASPVSRAALAVLANRAVRLRE